MSYKTGSQFVWMKYLLFIGLVLVCASFAYLTVWSFWQTKDWFTWLDYTGSEYVSLGMALVFQYGQGPVLFLRGLFMYRRIELKAALGRKQKGSVEYESIKHELNVANWSVWGLTFFFVVFGAVDAWTNRAQMYEGLDAKRAGGQTIGNDKYFFASVIGILAVFVEEGLGIAFSLASHTFNDIIEIHGYRRVGWLDVFADNARSLLSGGGGQKGGGGGGQPRPSSGFNRPGGGGGGNQHSVYAHPAPRPAPSSSPPPYNEPTYHTPTVRSEQTSMFKIND